MLNYGSYMCHRLRTMLGQQSLKNCRLCRTSEVAQANLGWTWQYVCVCGGNGTGQEQEGGGGGGGGGGGVILAACLP